MAEAAKEQGVTSRLAFRTRRQAAPLGTGLNVIRSASASQLCLRQRTSTRPVPRSTVPCKGGPPAPQTCCCQAPALTPVIIPSQLSF